jgi:CheY-like chemotaxis protein
MTPELPRRSTDEPFRVLLVDDEPDLTSSVAYCLEQEGHEVKTAVNGWEALGAVRAWQPHLVLLDVMMPHENGYRVSRFIKEDVRRGLLPPLGVILVTARKLDDPDRERTFADFSCADGVIYKPYDLDELLDHVRAWAGGAVPARA